MKSWTGQNSICSSKPSTRAVLIFCVFKLSLQSLYCQNSCPLTVPDPLGWTGTCHRVTKHVKKTWEGSIFPVIKNNFSFFDKKKELCPFYLHCLCLVSSIQLKGKRGSTVPEKKWCCRERWKLNSDISSSRCSTTTAGSKNSSMLQCPFSQPFFMLSTLLCFFYVSALKRIGLFTVELWMKQRKVPEIFIFSFWVHSRWRRVGA